MGDNGDNQVPSESPLAYPLTKTVTHANEGTIYTK